MIIYCKAAELAGAGTRLLDIGTKDGRHFVESEAEAVGIDIPGPSQADMALCLADGTRFPFEDATFDVVVANQVFEHVPPETCRMILAETVRVLTSGGTFLCSTPNRCSPIANHGEPMGFQYLPRPLATMLASRFLEPERDEGFIQGMFHISSFRLRWLLDQYFGEVRYDTPELGM